MATVAVGGGNKVLAGLMKSGWSGSRWDGGEDRFDFAVGDVVAEAVRGKQIKITRLEVVSLDLRLDAGAGADGAGNEVAHGRDGCLRGGDLTGAELIFDKGVVVGELLQVAVTEAVAAAVAYMSEPERGGGLRDRSEQSDQRGSHAMELGRLARLLVDGLIGGEDGRAEALLRAGVVAVSITVDIAIGLTEVAEEGLGSKLAGDFSGSSSAHTIADHKGPGFGASGAGVLVAFADEASVRQHRVDELICRHSLS